MSIGILPDGASRGGGGLGGTEGRAAEGEQSTEKEVGQAEAELNCSMEYVTTHLQEIPQRIR